MENVLITVNGHRCSSLNDIKRYASEKFASFVSEFFDENDYVVAHTSGSTGTPKTIRLLKSDMKTSAGMTNRFFSLKGDSVFYLNLSPDYIAGKMMIVRALMLNASIYEEEASNTPLANYSGNVIDLAAFVPSQLNYLVNNDFVLSKIRNMIVGGGEISEKMKCRLTDLGVNAYATYGMTETCSHIALALIDSENQPYKALPGVSFSLDERGCLVADVPHLSIGRVITNDMAVLVDDKSFYWKGRWDNVINTGGMKVFPEEVEHKIAPLFSQTRFYISSVRSEKWGEELVVALEYPSLEQGIIKTGDIKPGFVERMKQVLPAHSVPRKYIAVRAFEETKSGKIKRKKFGANLESL